MPAKVVLYYANWCVHCNHFKPEWEKLKGMSDETITFEEYEDSKNPDVMELNEIAGYPTIHIIDNGKKIEYLGKRTADAIMAFIKSPDKTQQQTGGMRLGFSKRKPLYYMMKYYKYKAKYIELLEQNGGSYRIKNKTKINPNYQEKYHKYKAKYQMLKKN